MNELRQASEKLEAAMREARELVTAALTRSNGDLLAQVTEDLVRLIVAGKNEPLLYTVEQTAALLQIGVNQTYELVAQGRIPSVRISERIIRVDRESLQFWIRREAGPDAAAQQLRLAK